LWFIVSAHHFCKVSDLNEKEVAHWEALDGTMGPLKPVTAFLKEKIEEARAYGATVKEEIKVTNTKKSNRLLLLLEKWLYILLFLTFRFCYGFIK
jgi:hypothetical protein